MCGIVGYIGSENSADIVYKGLEKLEYRGYDSAGIAVIKDDKIHIRRSVGKLINLQKNIKNNPISGFIGIGHTRWATHGKPSEENAHPHTDCSGKIVVVHNGIIENYIQIKQQLQKEGHKFASETDTEVIAHLIEKYYKGDLFNAVKSALKDIRGAYALSVICSDDDSRIIVARKDAPLILGVGKDENFIASDVSALLAYVRDVIFLENDDIAEIKKDSIKIFDKNGNEAKRTVQKILWDAIQAEKCGYKHFMLKEIYEQSQTIQDTFRGRISVEDNKILLETVKISKDFLNKISRICIVACGTSYHAGLVAKFMIEELTSIPAEVNIASEFRYGTPVLNGTVLTIFISQSGETADTLAALKLAKEKGATTLAICNVIGSSISREADNVLYTHCGPEIGVASTKAFTGQLTALYLLVMDFAIKKGTVSEDKLAYLIKQMWDIPIKVTECLKQSEQILEIAKTFHMKKQFIYLARNINYPIALEGALKLKEISYIYAEGYPAGEMKHGPIALIDENMPVMVIATKSKVYEKVLSNIEEAKARGAKIIAIANINNKEIIEKSDYQIFVPEVDEMFSPLINVIPLQFFSYYVSTMRGCDVDQPRNLAKSVTVE
ncbi:MAG: glutamine--fructose-6-phosphate transaminase (isomerizing) [Endomicrobiaceae bacterium]|jgi:glucosamine--fructose-6-phosphate aminotransferase (isomerizing)|nr:glutamine--fructose-6-phosphate transaminase (isomerizing) [Endomicrobiaceae bacterium]